MQRERALLLQQDEAHKNAILKALQVVADKETTPPTSNCSNKRKHEELGIMTQDQVQFKMLKILENIETKLFDQPNCNPKNSREKWHKDKEWRRKDFYFYYHTYGTCSHRSNQRKMSGENYKKNTTF